MENNLRSAQSILLSTSTNNNNNSSPPSHSLSRRASFTSCEVNSLKDEDTCKKFMNNFLALLRVEMNFFYLKTKIFK